MRPTVKVVVKVLTRASGARSDTVCECLYLYVCVRDRKEMNKNNIEYYNQRIIQIFTQNT